jgi:hypothetical protein
MEPIFVIEALARPLPEGSVPRPLTDEEEAALQRMAKRLHVELPTAKEPDG